MSWNRLDPGLRQAIAAALTPAQLEAFTLELAGYGSRAIAQALDLSRSSVLSRLENAHRRLLHAGLRQDGSGRWFLEDA